MKSSSRVETLRYQTQVPNDNEWEQQIQSEQLYNAFCRSSRKGKSNGSFITDRASDAGFNFLHARTEIGRQGEHFLNQSQGPALQKPSLRQQHSNFAVTANNSMTAKQNHMTGDEQQYPQTMSVSSQSSLDENYNPKADTLQVDDEYNVFHQKSAQLEGSYSRKQSSKKSRKQMQDEINQLRFELLACKENLDQANQRSDMLEKLLNQHSLEVDTKSNDDKTKQSGLDLSSQAEILLKKEKSAKTDINSAKEIQTNTNVALLEKARAQSMHLSHSARDLKIEEPMTSATEKKPALQTNFEEEKQKRDLEIMNADSVEEKKEQAVRAIVPADSVEEEVKQI